LFSKAGVFFLPEDGKIVPQRVGYTTLIFTYNWHWTF